jgi:AraC-like DNA-binding protein
MGKTSANAKRQCNRKSCSNFSPLLDSLEFEGHLIAVLKAAGRRLDIELKSPAMLTDPALRLDHVQWSRLLSNVSQVGKIEYEAWQDASEILCRCLINAETLGNALKLAERFPQNPYGTKLQSRSGGDETALEVAGNSSWIVNILQMASYLKLFSWLVGEPIAVRRLNLDRTVDNRASKQLGSLFNCEARIGSEQLGLIIDKSWLDRPVVRAYRDLRAVLSLPSLALIPWPAPVQAKDKVMQLLIKTMSRHGRTPTLPEIALLLGYGSSSLRRQLRQEGTSFQSIKNRWREQLAKELLCGSFPLVDIAPLVGFDSSSVFSRAFKSWTGMAPSTFRLSQRQT